MPLTLVNPTTLLSWSCYGIRRLLVKNIRDTCNTRTITFFGRFGIPKEVLSDRGTNFTSKLLNETAKRLGIGRILASPYHPESNGMLERWHSTLKAMLRKSGRGRKEWDILLSTLLFAYREATHEATGLSPFELVFDRLFEACWISWKSNGKDWKNCQYRLQNTCPTCMRPCQIWQISPRVMYLKISLWRYVGWNR